MVMHHAERNGDSVKVSGRCPFCGKSWEVMMDLHRYAQWQGGSEMVQRVFPEMSADQRELLITGVCCD
jgi:hypothetical protein